MGDLSKQIPSLAPELKAAEAATRAILAADPRNSKAWHDLAIYVAVKGEVYEGFNCIRTAIRLDPSHSDNRLVLIEMCMHHGRDDEAMDQLDFLIANRQHLARSVCYKAQILASRGQSSDAIKMLNDFLTEMPDDDGVWIILLEVAEAADNIEIAMHAACKLNDLLIRLGENANPEVVHWLTAKFQELSARLNAQI